MAVVAIDASGAIRASNATADAFFGRDLTNAVAVSVLDLIPGLDLADLLSSDGIKRINAKGRRFGDAVHMRARRADGAEAFIDIQAATFSVGDEAFLTLFIQDATAVVAAETAVQDLRAQITYNWRLNSLGEMASMVAHELNQPLSAIMNFLDAARTLIARPEIDREKVTHFVGSAAAQAERAGEVIRRLRSLMARDVGFHTEESVSAVIGEIMPLVALHARELDATISVEIAPDDVARCDRVQLQQLILNLVRNSLDAPSNDARRSVRIAGTRLTDRYRIVVEDNGPGVPQDMAHRLFDPLSSTKPGGMGLGLSICRTIVEAHGGSIDCVPSALGGAAFAFTLNDSGADA